MSIYDPVKVILIGPTGAGKSCLIYRLLNDIFPESMTSTIGAAYFRYNEIRVNQKKVPLNIWDSCGQDRFSSLLPLFLRDADIVLCCIDVVSLDQDKLDKLCELVDAQSVFPRVVHTLIVLTKIDILPLNNAEELTKMKQHVEKKNKDHVTTSAKTGEGIDHLMSQIRQKVMKIVQNREEKALIEQPVDCEASRLITLGPQDESGTAADPIVCCY